MKNISTPIFAIDFEGSRKIGVVEYGVAKISDGKIAETFTRICAPRARIPARDAKFFGIDNEQAMAMPPFEESLEQFCEWRKEGIFCSHNAAVEDSLLRDALPSPGIAPIHSSRGNTREWAPWIDTCALLKKIYPDLASAKLSDVVESFGLAESVDADAEKFCPPQRRKWHCALYDAVAAARLLIAICTQKGFEDVDLPWLTENSSQAETARQTLL